MRLRLGLRGSAICFLLAACSFESDPVDTDAPDRPSRRQDDDSSPDSESTSDAGPARPGFGQDASDGPNGAPVDPEPFDGGSNDETDAGSTDEPLLEYPVHCEPDTVGRPRAFFEVAGAADGRPGDYFRLPFPNDILRSGGTIDLTGYPSGGPIASGVIRAVDEMAIGFGNYPTVVFRFSGPVDFATVEERIVFRDITDPVDWTRVPVQYFYTPSRSNTVCQNSLSIRPADGVALAPSHVYAVWLESGIVGSNGLDAASSPHLEALLEATVPTDAALRTAYRAYEPLREHLQANEIAPSSLVNATVFTTDDPLRDMSALAELVRREPMPEATSWTRCEAGVPSPCPDATGSRACSVGHPLYDEYHALVTLPIYQVGDAPYLSEGGAVDFRGRVRQERVCVALSVPIGPMPEQGFPLVLYGHGAGGSMRSHLTSGVAERLAGYVPAGFSEPARIATLGFDAVQHGPRKGSSRTDSELLLFNVLNPDSARGTTLQAGADVMSMARYAVNLTLPSDVTGSEEIRFDGPHLVYWGHSQGGSQGAIAVPYTDEIHAVVFSGTGAGLIHSVLQRTDPPLVPDLVRDAVNDPGRNGELVFGGIFHPTLGMLQHWVDAVDPLHFAPHLVLRPLASHAPKHVFDVYGTRDTYSSATNLRAFASAAELGVAAPDLSADPDDALDGPLLAPPVSQNLTVAGQPLTAVVRQYGPPPDVDGHFVVFQTPAAIDDVVRFIAQATLGVPPEVGQAQTSP